MHRHMYSVHTDSSYNQLEWCWAVMVKTDSILQVLIKNDLLLMTRPIMDYRELYSEAIISVDKVGQVRTLTAFPSTKKDRTSTFHKFWLFIAMRCPLLWWGFNNYITTNCNFGRRDASSSSPLIHFTDKSLKQTSKQSAGHCKKNNFKYFYTGQTLNYEFYFCFIICNLFEWLKKTIWPAKQLQNKENMHINTYLSK